MKQLTPEQWKDHIVYLTRESPKVNMNGMGGGYLTKMVQSFDIDDVKQTYGGYEFSYIMKGRKDELLYKGTFRVEAPPRFDAVREQGGVAGAGAADATLAQQFVSMMREELGRMREQLANGDDGGATEKAVEMLGKASDKAMETILKQVPQAGSAASQLKELVEVGKTLGMFGSGGADGGIIGTIKVLKELGIIGGPAVDPMKSLETMLSIFKSLDDLRGGGGRRSNHWWDSPIAEKAVDALPGLFDTFRETRETNERIASARLRASENLRAMGRQPAPAPPGAAPGAAPMPPPISSSGLRTVRLDNATAPTAAPAPAADNEETMIIETIDRNAPAFDNFLKQVVVEMVLRGEHGEPIVDFLDGAKPGYSNNLVQFPPDVLTSYFARDPILQAAVSHPNWMEVLTEARKYILASGETDEELEPAGAAAGKPN